MSEAGVQVGVARIRAGAVGGRPGPATPRPAGPAVDEAAVRDALAEVMDPELPMLSVVDLGIVHRVEVAAGWRPDPRRDPADLRRLSGA